MDNGTNKEHVFRRTLRLRATPIVAILAIAAAALIRAPGVIVVLILGTLAYVYAALLDARTKIVLSADALIWRGTDTVTIERDDVAACTYKTFHAMSARDGRFFVFIVSDSHGQTIPLNQYGWGREERTQLFLQFQEWLASSHVAIDPATRQRLSDATRA